MTADERRDFALLLDALRYWMPKKAPLEKFGPTKDPVLLAHFETWNVHIALCQRIQQRLEDTE